VWRRAPFDGRTISAWRTSYREIDGVNGRCWYIRVQRFFWERTNNSPPLTITSQHQTTFQILTTTPLHTPTRWQTPSLRDGSERTRTPSRERWSGVNSSPRSGLRTTLTLRSPTAVSAAQTCTCCPLAGAQLRTVREYSILSSPLQTTNVFQPASSATRSLARQSRLERT
jgi:hypothetical protein